MKAQKGSVCSSKTLTRSNRYHFSLVFGWLVGLGTVKCPSWKMKKNNLERSESASYLKIKHCFDNYFVVFLFMQTFWVI